MGIAAQNVDDGKLGESDFETSGAKSVDFLIVIPILILHNWHGKLCGRILPKRMGIFALTVPVPLYL